MKPALVVENRVASAEKLLGEVFSPPATNWICDRPVLFESPGQTWEKLVPKWKGVADLNVVFAPQNPLGQWREAARRIYGLELRLPAKRGQL